MKISFRSFAFLLLLGASLFFLSCATPFAADMSSPGQEYSWRLMPDGKTLQFDVADAVKEPGTYIATWQWKRGDSALKIKSVALYAGEEKISEDTHVGETGITNVKNVYAFELPKATTNVGPYTLRAQVESIGGANSFGTVTVRKAKPREIPQEYSWRLKPDNSTFQFDVADAIGEAGTYIATFQWKRGDYALKIKSVAVYQGDTKVSEDVHVGETGVTNIKNVYTLELPQTQTNAEPYTLRAEVEGVNGTSSFGILTVRKAIPVNIIKESSPNEYSWKLAPDVTTLEFDANNIIKEAGTYLAKIQWKQGQNALNISSVALYEGDKKVAEDVHEGRTGFNSEDNAYTLTLPAYRTGQETYTLRAQVEGAAGTDCSGILTLSKTK